MDSQESFKRLRAIAKRLTSFGIAIVPTYPGFRGAAFDRWTTDATTRMEQVENWIANGYYLNEKKGIHPIDPAHNWICVAKFEGVGGLDIDDYQACLDAGMPPLPEGIFIVDTPRGTGMHVPFIQTDETRKLGSVRNVKIGDSRKPIFEMKGHNQAWCAPWQWRDDGGYYKPRDSKAPLMVGIPADIVKWIGDHSRPQTEFTSKGSYKFHPSFELGDFLEHYDCTEQSSYEEDGTLWVVVESCPLCGKEKNAKGRSGLTKFIFGGTNFGFVCLACDKRTDDLHEEFEEYPYVIYEDDDDELLLESMGAEPADDATPEEETVEVHSPPQDYKYSLDDTGNAERLVRLFGENIRFIYETGEWIVWGKSGWRKDKDGMLMRMTKKVIDELIDEAEHLAEQAIREDGSVDEAKESQSGAFASHAKTTAQKERRKAMIDLASVEKGVVTNFGDWDADDWLFNCANGTVELKTQTFRPHRKEDMCSKTSPVHFDPNATCPTFENFLLQCMCGDHEMVDFLQESVGVSLTGDTSQQSIFFNVGSGQNGKGTFMELFRYILGEGQYAKDIDFTAFVADKNGHKPSHRSDIAAIRGFRLVTATEGCDGHTLDEALIKHITGNEPITVREVYSKPITFTPKLKLWFQTNYEPIIKGQDKGIWRRVKRISWDYEVPDDQIDFSLPAKLQAEAPGVLNWALKGLARYLQRGKLKYPAKVQAATDQYREEMDIIGRFAKERLVFQFNASAIGSQMYQTYCQWCKANGHFANNSRRFYAEFRKRFGGKVVEKAHKLGSNFEGVGLSLSDGSYPTEELAR
jgi:P4 family phage/plasmid primase-like protien